MDAKKYFSILILLISGNVFAQNQNMSIQIESLSKHPIQNIQINNLDYYYIEKGEGETVFLLHGFPDLANTWDETIDELSKKYHCVAPFLRGYYPTSMPSDHNYGADAIADDINELANKLGKEKYYVIGQDWGASVAYTIFNLFPERVIKGITVAIPHPSVIKPSPLLLYRARHFLKFANEKKSLPFFKKNNFNYLDVLYKRWSPGWADYKETSDIMKKTFQEEGRAAAALGYYWTFNKTRNDKTLIALRNKIPTMPIMAIAGKKDGALVLSQFKKMHKKMNSDFELVIHDNAGHFLHREVPDFFVENVLRFLNE